MSVVGIGIAVWLITTSLLGDPNALTAEGDNPTQGAPVEPEPTTELPPTVNEPVVVMQEGTGNVVLRPVLAILSGVELDQSGEEDVLAHWGADGEAWWRFRIIKPAIFRVVVRYAAEDAWAGAQVELSLGDQKKTVTVRASGGTDQFHEDEYFLAANSSGQHDFRVRAVGLAGEGLMVLKSIQLEPRTGNLPK